MNWSRLVLYLGDLVAIFLFVFLGRESHEMPTGSDAVAAMLNTAAPFMIGWLLVAPWFGAYRDTATTTYRGAIRAVLFAILPAVLVGALVRAVFVERFSPPVFYVVTAGVMLLLLLGWRLLYVLLSTRVLKRNPA